MLSSMLFLLLLSTSYGAYDYYKLAQQWPTTYCRHSSQTIMMPCNPNVPIKFTLHGLWPSNHSGSTSSYCSQTKLNNTLIVGNLRTRLIAEWPNLNGGDFKFWSHEWEKHGTCSSMAQNPLGYLSLALTIKKKRNSYLLEIILCLDQTGATFINCYPYRIDETIWKFFCCEGYRVDQLKANTTHTY
ncbi:ribonuclease S-6-like [Cicer arietinum]|uniref:ribonuclease S-6-like n=1 Tax=Cicer arietinum TaxID=3827 RepID=UPI003CC6D4A4